MGLSTKPPRAGRGYLWPLLLIGGGLLLLAANLGWLGWEWLGSLVRLWPLALIAIGVDLFTGGRRRGALLLATAVVAALLLLLAGGSSGDQARKLVGGTALVEQRLGEASRAELNLTIGASKLVLGTGVAPGLLLAGRVVSRTGENVKETYRLERGTAKLALEGRTPAPSFFGLVRAGEWDLRLTDAVPVALSVQLGVGDAELDLSRLWTERLELSTGVGTTTLTLPRSGNYAADVETGVGNVTVRLPDGLAARVVVSRGIGRVTAPREFVRTGDVYTSPGYDSATDRVELRVTGGVGSVVIERIR